MNKRQRKARLKRLHAIPKEIKRRRKFAKRAKMAAFLLPESPGQHVGANECRRKCIYAYPNKYVKKPSIWCGYKQITIGIDFNALHHCSKIKQKPQGLTLV